MAGSEIAYYLVVYKVIFTVSHIYFHRISIGLLFLNIIPKEF